MTEPRAKRLLQRAAREPERVKRHLMVAAAFREVLSPEPIVVGGTAEEYWTAAEYHPTDLDLCAPLSREEQETLRRLGFNRRGRHWVHPHIEVAVEFPNDRIDGDESRVTIVRVAGGSALVIGLDDLYVDRLRQASATEHEGAEFQSALAVVAATDDQIDWPYVRARIRAALRNEPVVGERMKRVDQKLRSRVRKALRGERT